MKKKYPYLIVTLITILVFILVFYIKGIFPFGGNSLIYGDMHDQITAFYYHFYDCFHGTNSLFVNFTTSGGINFFGIMAYYILSPFTFLLLLFQREDVYLAVSIIIALKCLTSGLTMLWALRSLFKEKLNVFLSIFLALGYAFSGYFFCLYQITPWMDAVYLFPLIAVGLKKTLELKKPYLYIITLTASLICSFYVSIIGLIFIFLLSLIYIHVYVEKENRKKSIVALGITTVISLLLAVFVILPSYLEISVSSRLDIQVEKIFNSKFGPISDKLSFFVPGIFTLVGVFLLFIHFKKCKKFMKFFFPSFILLFIPYVIEPINKMLHMGSYAMFPNRYGYILFFLLAVGAAYYFSNIQNKTFTFNQTIRRILAVVVTTLMVACASMVISMNYGKIQLQIYKLTISGNMQVMLAIFGSGAFILLAALVVTFLLERKDKFYYPLMGVLVLTQIIYNSLIYLGIDHYQMPLTETYHVLNDFSKTYQEGDYFRVKNNTVSLITNSGMVMKYQNLDHFTSLVDSNNLTTLKLLGYKSYWTKTFSKNGTMFSDILLANQYLITKGKDVKDYTLVTSSGSYQLFRFNKDVPYGYFTTNASIIEERNSFKIENEIYKSITGKNEDLFTIYDYHDFAFKNISILQKYKVYYSIDNTEFSNYMQKTITLNEKSIIYLDVLNSISNTYDSKSYKTLNIYINDKLFMSDYPNKENNGTLNLGTFEKGTVNIKIELAKDTKFTTLEIGVMSYQKMMDFIEQEKVDSTVDFNRNHINLTVNSEKEGIYFIPVSYIDGYKVTVNGENKEVVKVFDNYLGVKIGKGEQKIQFTYFPKGWKLGVMVSSVTLILALILFRFKLYDRLLEIEWLEKLATFVYLFAYSILLVVLYLFPLICFFVSYITYLG